MENDIIIRQAIALFPSLRENIDLLALSNLPPARLLAYLTPYFPAAQLDFARKQCDHQERKVMQNVREIKQVDLLQEIEELHPKVQVRNLSDDELQTLFVDYKQLSASSERNRWEQSPTEMGSGELKNLMEEENYGLGHDWADRGVDPFDFN
jgi:hypothetical protein